MSCDDQIAACRDYAERHGWEVVGEYRDDAISGTRGRQARRGWDQLLEFIEGGGLAGGVVLTWDIDRWSRDWADGMIEALRLHKLGVDLADTKDGVLEQDGLAGKILLTLKVAGADEFIQKLRRNVRRGLEAKRRAGYWTGPAPFGLVTERQDGGSVLAPRPGEIEIYHRIMRELDAGATPTALARRLNREGIPTRRGSKWTQGTIVGIAVNPVYIGKIPVYRSHREGITRSTRWFIARGDYELLEGRHEPVIDLALWRRVRDRWAPSPNTRAKNRPRKYPLSGLVVCAVCGRRCFITGGKWPYRNYRCGHYGVEGCGNRRVVRVTLLEDAVRRWALEMANDRRSVELAARELALREWEEARRLAEERAPIEAEIAELQRKQERLLEALYAGNAPSLINEKLHQVEEAIQALQRELDTMGAAVEPAEPREVADQIAALLRDSAADLQGLRPVIDRIVLPPRIEDPITLEAFGRSFPLEIPKTKKDRTRAAAAGELRCPWRGKPRKRSLRS